MANALSQAALKDIRFTTPLGSDVFRLVSLRGRAALSELFGYRLEVLVERGRAVDFAALLGAEVSVQLEQKSDQGKTQRQLLHGIVRRLGEVGDSATHVAYQLEVVPRFWLWTQRRRCRIFQEQTTPQILEQVLEGLDVRFELSNDYRVHNYRTQFRESDYDFASRLMEEEGVYFYFREAAAGHQLVLADNSPASAELPGGPLRFSAERPQAWEAPRVRRWQKFQELRPARITLADHSFQLPEQSLEASRTETGSVAAGTIRHQPGLGSQHDLEIFDYPGGYAYRFDGIDAAGQRQPGLLRQVHEQNERTVRVRVEEQAAHTLVIEAAGDDVRPVPGMRFTLSGHGHADGDYLVTWVEHELETSSRSSDGAEMGYGNSFGALPLALPYRPPRRTSPPRPEGPQTATVVGPKGEAIHCDPFGRIKVHFHWDRAGRRDGSDSCWVRVASSWAGAGFGMVTLPRVGHEVVVSFLDGDVDRPLVTGSVYNANNMPPMPLPDRREYSTLLSQSLSGDLKKFTGLSIRDQEKEQLVLQASNEIELDAGDQIVITAPQQWTSNIGATQIQSVGWYFPKLGGPAWKEEGGWDRTTDVLQDILGGGRIDVTRGTHATACIGESNQYTWFSRNEVTIDPFSWSAGQTSGGWSRNVVKGKVPTAKTTAVYGAVQNIGYGPMLNVQSGQVIGLVGTHPGFQKYATFHAALTSACCVLPGLYSMTGKNAYLDANSAADLLGNACLAFLVTAERNYAKEKAAQDALNITAQYSRYPNLMAQAEQFVTLHDELVEMQALDLAANSAVVETHDVTGWYSLRGDWLNLHGVKGIFLNTKDFAPIGLTTLGRLVLAGGWDQLILLEPPPRKTMSLRNGPTCGIELTETTIRLKAGMATLEIGPNDIKLNGATITIDATGQAAVSAPQVTVGKAGANGTLKGAAWNVST